MKVMLPIDRIDYLNKERKARVLKKEYYLCSNICDSVREELISELEEEIRNLSDEIDELWEAEWSGKEIYK